MAQNTITAMEAHILVLLDHADKWSHAVRNDNGLVYTLFTGSAGQTYWTTARSCSCKSFTWRQTCAHQRAVSQESERAQAREQVRTTTLRMRYEELFANDELEDVH